MRDYHEDDLKVLSQDQLADIRVHLSDRIIGIKNEIKDYNCNLSCDPEWLRKITRALRLSKKSLAHVVTLIQKINKDAKKARIEKANNENNEKRSRMSIMENRIKELEERIKALES